MEIKVYETSSGKRPFEIWLKSIKEFHTKAKILTRLDRLKIGNFGDCKTISSGLYELRIHYGPGIGIYYTKINNVIILLLCGGDKGTQTRDINKAKEYVKDYQLYGENYGKK